MSDVPIPANIRDLPVPDRIELATKNWESVVEDSATVGLSDEHKRIIDDRIREADEMQVQPTLIHNWVNCVLSQAERAFESQKHETIQFERHHSSMTHLLEKLDTKNAVIADLAERLMQSDIPNSPFDA